MKAYIEAKAIFELAPRPNQTMITGYNTTREPRRRCV